MRFKAFQGVSGGSRVSSSKASEGVGGYYGAPVECVGSPRDISRSNPEASSLNFWRFHCALAGFSTV